VLISRALQAERRLSSGNALRLAALATIFLTVLGGAVQSIVDTGDVGSSLGRRLVGCGHGHNRWLRRHRDPYVPGRIVAITVMLVGVGLRR
jgi:hypothetical protein